MQNYTTNVQNITTNRLCESGNEKLLRSKRKHSQLYNYDQQNFHLIKKFKNSSNNFLNQFQNNFSMQSDNEICSILNDQRQILNPLSKELNNICFKVENTIEKGKIKNYSL